MQRLPLSFVAVTAILLVCAAPRSADAYSVLAHEALIDSAWEDVIAPMLRERFPAASESQILKARAYAYGGSVIQDLGYYPFGSHFFTNLLHYVRSGDFIEALVRNAGDVYEYSFALGALAHYAADVTGHTVAVNRAVPLIYPKLRAKFGDEVTYADDPKRHIMVEFAFDVVHVAGSGYVPATYSDFIGFEVSEPLLARAFHDTYGLDLREVFSDVDLVDQHISLHGQQAHSGRDAAGMAGKAGRHPQVEARRARAHIHLLADTCRITRSSSGPTTASRDSWRDSSCSWSR